MNHVEGSLVNRTDSASHVFMNQREVSVMEPVCFDLPSDNVSAGLVVMVKQS